MRARATALLLVVAVALFGAGPRVAEVLCKIDGRVHAGCCCRSHGHGGDDQLVRTSQVERRDCCEAVEDPVDVELSTPPSDRHDARAVAVLAAAPTREPSWARAPSAAPIRGPPRAGAPPLYRRHCSLLL